MLITDSFRFDCDDEKIDAVINGELDWQTVFADENEPEVVKYINDKCKVVYIPVLIFV